MGTYINLTNFKNSKTKELNFFKESNTYRLKSQDSFFKIPGYPICYWISRKIGDIFENNKKIGDIAPPKQGLATGNNDKFLRAWTEVEIDNILFNCNTIMECVESGKKWFPYNKGGEFRKWYGNNDLIVNWFNDGEKIRHYSKSGNKISSRPQNTQYYFKKALTWSFIGTTKIGMRYRDNGFIFDVQGSSIFPKNEDIYYILGFFCSNVVNPLLVAMNPTLSFQVGNIASLPIIFSENINLEKKVEDLVIDCIKISKDNWNSRETSWDFTQNEIIKHKTGSGKIKDAYNAYCAYWEEQFYQLHQNEEELNKIFIEIYGLEDEITPDVPLEDITILKEETQIKNGELNFKKDAIIKHFLSYSVGCVLGRYSIDKEGLILANQGETLQNFKETIPNPSFYLDADNIVPVLDDEYFTDDLMNRFKEFLRVTFGNETLYENMDFIASGLKKRSNESSEETIRRYFLNDFYKDHCKMYKKRPIYWLFTSGKQKAFNALIYMHRYNKETLAKMRVEYLLKLEEKLIAQKATLNVNSSDSKERQQSLNKQAELNKKIEEIRKYDEKLKHLADQYIDIDLDDGVKKNYQLFEEITAKI